MHERRFNRNIERLRDPQRVAMLEVERVVQLALEGINNVGTVLDIGAGTGVFSETFAARGLKVTGLDANPEMIEMARKLVPSSTFQSGEAEALPFPDDSFDLVFMGLLLHETDDRLAALKEAHRVASMRLAVLEWPTGDTLAGPPQEHRLSAEKVEELARQAGFAGVQSTRLTHVVLYKMERQA